MSRRVNYANDALKELKRIPANVTRLIRSKINDLASDPVAQGNNVTQLVGSDTFRLRVGDYRVIFYLTAETVEVVRIGPRGSVYE